MKQKNMPIYLAIIISLVNGTNNLIKYLIKTIELPMKLKKINNQFLKDSKNFLIK